MDADNLDTPNITMEGRVPNPNVGRDASALDWLRSPQSLIDGDGVSRRTGVYERRGRVADENGVVTNPGLDASKRAWDAQVNMEVGVADASVKLKEIDTNLRSLAATKKDIPKVYDDFINLIELDKTDPQRMAVEASNTPLGKALKMHDEMTEQFRQYIIESRKLSGIDTPPDWGITETGYYRHLFLGDLQIWDGSTQVGNAATYAQASKMALDYVAKNPNANIVARARNISSFAGDPKIGRAHV